MKISTQSGPPFLHKICKMGSFVCSSEKFYRETTERQYEGHLQLHTGEAESELLLQQSPVLLFRELMSPHYLCIILPNRACSTSAGVLQHPHILECKQILNITPRFERKCQNTRMVCISWKLRFPSVNQWTVLQAPGFLFNYMECADR